MSELKDLQKQAMAIRQKYAELNKKDGHDAWAGKDYAMGFAGDFGDLMKLVMAKENMRYIDDVDAKLKHELADCLWSILVLAEHYQVDLDTEFQNTMKELDTRIAGAMK
jgi:NTP pyrophosphatase (non-canonical NTP hydrolase)